MLNQEVNSGYRKWSLPDHQHGVVMILVLGAVTIALILGLAYISLADNHLRDAAYYDYRLAALDLAEAGVEHGLALLRQDPNWRTGLDHVSLGLGTYSVTVKDLGGSLIELDSTGEARGVRRRVKVTIRTGSPLLRYALFSNEDYTFNYDSTIKGDVHVNGNVTVKNKTKVEIDGTLSLTGAIDNKKGQLTATQIITGASPVQMPGLDDNWYLNRADTVVDQDLFVWNPSQYNGKLVYVNGKLTILGTMTGQATFYATKGIDVLGYLDYSGTNDLIALVTPKDIDIFFATSLNGFYFAGRKLRLQGWGPRFTVGIDGILAGQELDIKNNIKLTYDDRFVHSPLVTLPGSGLNIVDWQEN